MSVPGRDADAVRRDRPLFVWSIRKPATPFVAGDGARKFSGPGAPSRWPSPADVRRCRVEEFVAFAFVSCGRPPRRIPDYGTGLSALEATALRTACRALAEERVGLETEPAASSVPSLSSRAAVRNRALPRRWSSCLRTRRAWREVLMSLV